MINKPPILELLRQNPHSLYAYSSWFLANIGYYLFVPYSAIILVKDYGMSMTQYGQLLFVYFIIKHAAMFPTGIVVDKMGCRCIAIAGSLLVSISYAGMLFTTKIFPMSILFAISGLGSALFQPAAKTYIIQGMVEKYRMGAFSIWNMLMNLGSVVGPLAGACIAGRGAKMMFISSLLSYGAASFAFAVSPRNTSINIEKTNPVCKLEMQKRRKLSFPPAFIIFCTASIGFYFLLSQYMVTFPVIVEEQAGRGLYGMLFSACAGIGVLLQTTIIKKIENRFSAFTIASLAMLMLFCGYMLLLFNAHFILIAAAMVIFTFSKIFFLPTADTYTVTVAPPSRIGEYLGFSSIAMAIGWSLGYIYGARLYEHFIMEGSLNILWSIMALIAVLSCFIFMSLRALEAMSRV